MTEAFDYLFKVLRDVLTNEEDGFGTRILSDEYIDVVVDRFKFCLEDIRPELCTILHHIWIDEKDAGKENIVKLGDITWERK